ncbi:MAG: GTP-binding protein EngB [Candidatus Thorarchaeota archaeon]|nr:MAG: GTP-binding protein EngB [Candidatus Thorarchaeota archaeon]
MPEQDRSGIDPEDKLIVIAGRSNVGKSSMIRALTGRKVRVGKRPGSTKWEQLIDLGAFLLVDMAGFGFMAGQSKTAIEEMKTEIVRKLESWGRQIVLSILIVDISLFRTLFERWDARDEIPIDVEFYSFLSEISPEVIVAANKSDKLKKKQLEIDLEFMKSCLVEIVPSSEPIIVPISATKGKGVLSLKDAVECSLRDRDLGKPSW